jgi:hypothetical protein
MDVETCWKWFNNVFFPEVKRRTGRSALLLLDNAPGHFQAFERDNIRVVFFPPNCTSWKQPCDMGIIAALKKRYKYLYLKDVLDFYQLDDEAKARKKEQARRLRRGSAGVLYGNPAHLLDAANYVKEAWDSVSEASIRNAFRKAELMPSELRMEDRMEDEYNNTDIEYDMMNAFEELNLCIDSSELNEFIHADDENNEMFAASVLEDVEEVMETMNISEIAENEDDDEADPLETESHTQFEGFEALYEQVLDIEDQLLCHEVQIEADETYDDLKKSFEVFQNKLRTLMLRAKRKKLQNLRQMTIHDYYVR